MKKLILLVSIAVIVAIGVVINTNLVIQAEYWEAPESKGRVAKACQQSTIAAPQSY